MILGTNFVLVYVLAVRYIECSHTYPSKMHKCELLVSCTHTCSIIHMAVHVASLLSRSLSLHMASLSRVCN